MVEIDR